jgi:isocitrate dehydrogenase
MATQKIVWTHIDEAPMLATFSLLPIVEKFVGAAGVEMDLVDISLAGRVIANFPEFLTEEQRMSDKLAELGELAKTPECNIIKLPNISASIPQLVGAITELQAHGYNVPSYPENPTTDEERDIAARYSKVLGSAVNPVLREGNSDRRVAGPVKKFAQKNPHSMGVWHPDSKTHVAHMSDGDFFSSEQSVVMANAGSVRIEHEDAAGTVTPLKSVELQAGEVFDSSMMSVAKLSKFFEEQFEDAKAQGILASLHLKATMMKVSDPIMFGHAVKVYFKDVLEKHADTLASIGASPNNGFGDVVDKMSALPEAKQAEIRADIEATYAKNARLAMVNSDKGITNLHYPNDVIIDASMPAAIRGMDGLGGGMWCPDSAPGARDSHLEDQKSIIPDRCYAGVYKACVDFCKENGAFDVSTMGSVSNVGLMAQKAQEYGSHDKTFECETPGTMRVVDEATGETLMSHTVEVGDIWRACQTKDEPIRDWVRLAVARARATGAPAVFWLNPERAHDRNLLAKIDEYLPLHDTTGLEILRMPPAEACVYSMQRAKEGKDTISVTGNVLRDYLTDLFPIIELGTSAKMLSIVPLLAGGGLYETGAGGSAPKHVQQFEQVGHLRWDSLGEFLALGASLDDLAAKTSDSKLQVMANALNDATSKLLDENKSPGRKPGTLTNAASHYYLGMYWAEALKNQTDDADLAAQFGPLADSLAANEEKINAEFAAQGGSPVDFGGYYHPDLDKLKAAMRPSATLNAIIDSN